jgi:phosphocarrier protein HPr
LPQKEVTKVFTVKNKLGLHARVAAVFVRLSSKYESEIQLVKDSYEVNGKSILGVLSLAATMGSEIEVTTRGEDAEAAIHGIEELIESGFGEGV